MQSDHNPESDAVIPSVVEVFFKALVLSEKESAAEIGIDHLLAALDSRPTTQRKSVEETTGPFVPIPHRDKVFSNEAKTAIEAACAPHSYDLEHLTIDSLRTALVAARRDRTK